MRDACLLACLQGGTLLGAIRSNAILDHEFDLDLSIYLEDMSKLAAIKPKLQQKYG